ncbi:MAG: AAA family ATPase [Gammaproteobacteria bacterium]|nr:AAA family ATPase [Gammaproteobacteria bacterium]
MTGRLLTALQNPALFDHPVTGFEVIETHISWVLLTGPYAYKIKKPVDLGFLDFTTLEQRRHYCHQEMTLNRRLAPQLYLEVVAITGSEASPRLEGDGDAIEYAVKMKQFDQPQQLDRVLARGELLPAHIDQLAARVAAFHQRIEVATTESPHGTAKAIFKPVTDNFLHIEPLLESSADKAALSRLQEWSVNTFQRLEYIFAERKANGYIRNCHGDMHLANMVLMDNEVVIFDCIEFNANLRWIDIISEVAFTTMDLAERGRPDFAARYLNTYLHYSGDYSGLAVLRFYQIYRALVRAKVTVIRMEQKDITPQQRDTLLRDYRRYIALAEQYTIPHQTPLIITHGVSGSGKTTLTQPALEHYGLIRLRSDVERKRLFGLSPDARTDSAPGSGIYSPDAGQRTYRYLAELARTVINSGWPVVVDATFLKRSERELFQHLARELGIKFIIIHFYADEQLLRHWVMERQQQARDASEATLEILDRQLTTQEPLTDDEADMIIKIDSGMDTAARTLINHLKNSM